MPWLLPILGSKVFRVIAAVALLGFAAWAVVGYIERNAVEDLKLQEKIEEVLIWERTKDATDNAPDNADDALDFLRSR